MVGEKGATQYDLMRIDWAITMKPLERMAPFRQPTPYLPDVAVLIHAGPLSLAVPPHDEEFAPGPVPFYAQFQYQPDKY
jgi:hypothetical protein